MISSVSNNSVQTKNNFESAGNDQAAKTPANASGSGGNPGKISYGDHNGASKGGAVGLENKAQESSSDGKLKEMDGMLNRLKELLGRKASPDKPEKDAAAGSNMEKKGAADKSGKVDKEDKDSKTDKTDETDKTDKADKADKAAKGDVEEGLKAKAMEVLNKMSEVLMSILGKTPPTSSAP